MGVNFQEDIKPISYIKTNAADMMKYVNDNKNSIIITQNGEAKAVILDVDSYQNLVNAVNLMKIISIGDRDIKNGKVVTHEDLKKKVSKIFA